MVCILVARQSPPGHRAWPRRCATVANLVSPGLRMRLTAGFIVTGTAVVWCVTFRVRASVRPPLYRIFIIIIFFVAAAVPLRL